jgi:hypothetical protein
MSVPLFPRRTAPGAGEWRISTTDLKFSSMITVFAEIASIMYHTKERPSYMVEKHKGLGGRWKLESRKILLKKTRAALKKRQNKPDSFIRLDRCRRDAEVETSDEHRRKQ